MGYRVRVRVKVRVTVRVRVGVKGAPAAQGARGLG